MFDSLNYLDNLKLGVDAAGFGGRFVEGTLCYTRDVTDSSRGKCSLEYYLELSQKLGDMGVHFLEIKNMAGILNPCAAKLLVSYICVAHPNTPIHVQTHDTSGSGMSSMLSTAEVGANTVDDLFTICD